MAFLVAAIGFAAGAFAQEEPWSETRLLLEKWIEARRLLSEERRDWRVAREILEERIGALRRDIEYWREKTAQAQQEMLTTEQEMEALRERREELLRAVSGVTETISRLETELRALLARAPAPLRERVKLLSQRLPEDPAQSRMSLGERAQNVAGILNEMDKFAREITISSEVRELPDGTAAEVSVLYFGFGQAWYCNVGRGIAGVGRPGSEGWVWEARNEIAGDVAAAIAMFRNERPAAYVPLPASVR